MKFLKQSTSTVIPMGPFVDKTDGVTLKADGTTITDIDHASTGIFLIKNGGTGAIRHATVTASVADAYGMMLVTLDTTDTNTLGRLRVSYAKAATYLPVWEDFQVLPATMFDSLVTGSGGAIPSAVAGASGGLFIAGTNAATTITTALTTTFTGNLTGTTAKSPATLAAADVSGNVPVDLQTIKTRAVTCAAGVTVPTSIASPTNITAASGVSLAADQAVNVTKVNGTSQTARDLGASVLLSSGTGAGQLDFTSGVVKANLAQILGTAITGTAAQLAAAFTKFFDKASPTGTINSLPDAVPDTSGGLGLTNGTKFNKTVDLTAGQTIAATVAGAVGSVTGAVGSVTGNVGGNVTGSVGSVSATVSANLTQILGTALTETAGYLAAAFKKFFNIATPASTMDALTLVATASTLTTLPSPPTDWLAAAAVKADAVTKIQNGLSTFAVGGNVVATNMRGTDSAMLAASYTAPDNADIILIKAKTDNLPASPAAVSDIPTTAQMADKILGRNLAGGSDTGRTVKDALRTLRNKVSINPATGAITVYAEDDTTPAWTGTVTSTAGFDPITTVDPT